jgi:hypothetical protein
MTEKTKFLLTMLLFVTVLLIVVFGALAAEANRWKARVDYAATLEIIQIGEKTALYDPATGEIIASTEGANDD